MYTWLDSNNYGNRNIVFLYYIHYFHRYEFTPVLLLHYNDESVMLTCVKSHYVMTCNKVQPLIQWGGLGPNLHARQM